MWPRKSSLTAKTIKQNEAAATTTPPATLTTIPDLPAVSGTPIPLASLTPKDVILKSARATEVDIQYSLPPTCTSIGGSVDVMILIRPSKLFKVANDEANKIQRELQKYSMEYQMAHLKKMGTMTPQQMNDEAFAHSRKQREYYDRIAEVWSVYAKKSKELLPNKEGAEQFESRDGFYLADIQQNIYVPILRFNSSDTFSVKNSPETNNVTLKSLGSNIFYEIVLRAKRSDKTTDDEGETDLIWSPASNSLGFSTKTAPWQLALEKVGLRHLIEPFSENGFDSFEQWLNLTQDVKVELGIDAAAEQLIQDILSQNGIVTPAEKQKIERERVELNSAVANLLAELKSSVDKMSLGDAVIEKSGKKHRFGVIVSNVDGNECSVRFEDPRSKDPMNSQIENHVKISHLQRAGFSLFLSHAQAEAQNQVAHLSVLLRDRDAKLWFDMDSERLEAKDMVRGIYNSQAFLLYLTRSYFDRYFCRMEFSVALALKKTMIIVFEPDERHGGISDYVKLVDACTLKYPEFRTPLLGTEAIPMARRAFQRRAVVDEISKRAGLGKQGTSSNEKATTSSSNGTESNNDVSDLRQMILDLRMEINDLKAENQELRILFESISKE